jgi:hypothetical protein
MCYSVDVVQWEGIIFSLVYFSVIKETSFAFHQFEQCCDDPSQWVISTLPKAECNAQSCFIFILTGNFIQLDGAMMTHLSGCNSASNCWMSTHFLCLPSWIFQSVRQRYADPSQWVMTLLLTTECPTTFMVLVETEFYVLRWLEPAITMAHYSVSRVCTGMCTTLLLHLCYKQSYKGYNRIQQSDVSKLVVGKFGVIRCSMNDTEISLL